MFENVVPKELLPFLMVLNSHSDNNYIVGGAVRDLLSGKEPNDYDVVTDIPMSELITLFTEGGFKVKQTGVAHFVLNVYKNGYGVEISNFRKDVVCNGRQAECEVGTIEDDSKRRDFTINAVYMSTRFDGTFVDPTGTGCTDIKQRKLRFVGDPKERIREDFLRVWRAYRFISKGFVPDKKLICAIREMYNEAHAKTSPERIRSELEKMVL